MSRMARSLIIGMPAYSCAVTMSDAVSVSTSGFGSVSLIHAAPVIAETTPNTVFVVPDS